MPNRQELNREHERPMERDGSRAPYSIGEGTQWKLSTKSLGAIVAATGIVVASWVTIKLDVTQLHVANDLQASQLATVIQKLDTLDRKVDSIRNQRNLADMHWVHNYPMP